MPVIEINTSIQAPIERCFLLSLSIDAHTLSTIHTHEKAVGGITSRIMQLGDQVTWRARHFGIWQELSSKITAYQFPDYFCDEMIKGAFKSIRHEHYFSQLADYTHIKDIFYFESPLGILGKLANMLVLERYMKKLLVKRNNIIKQLAEGEQWKKLLPV